MKKNKSIKGAEEGEKTDKRAIKAAIKKGFSESSKQKSTRSDRG